MKKIIILSLVVLVIASLFIGHSSTPTAEIEMFAKVSNYTGFNVDTEAIFFGTLIPSSQSTRIINITNNNGASLVKLKTKGELKKWVTLSEKQFTLEKDEIKTIKINIAIPKNAQFGEYEGVLKIYFHSTE